MQLLIECEPIEVDQRVERRAVVATRYDRTSVGQICQRVWYDGYQDPKTVWPQE